MPRTTDEAPSGAPGPLLSPAVGTGSTAGDPRLRPMTWRLPLVVMLIVGALTLRHVDEILKREYRNEASTQAVQTDALLESFVKQRVALLGGLRAIVATSSSLKAAEAGFARLSA